MKTIDRVKKKFVEKGLKAVTTRKPTGRVFAKKNNGDIEDKMIAKRSSPAQEGHYRWNPDGLPTKSSNRTMWAKLPMKRYVGR